MAQSLKEKIRQATVAQDIEYPSENIEVAPGVEVEVRSLSWEAKGRVTEGLSDIVPAEGLTLKKAIEEEEFTVDFDQQEYVLRLLQSCCYVPGTDELVFEAGDVEKFKAQPASQAGWFGKLVEAATELNKAGNLKTTEETDD